MKPLRHRLVGALAACALSASAQTPALEPLPQLDVPAYMGTWYQVAWFPNRFQSPCVSDTSATYRALPEGRVEVTNRCRREDGRMEDIVGLARPDDATVRGPWLSPARLEVSFLPAALRWLPIWGRYWVIALAEDGRYAVVSEPQRKYLWVLARAPRLSPADELAIRSLLVQRGFDLTRWQAHPHTAAP